MIHASGGNGMEVSCGIWWIDGTTLVNGDELLPSAERR